MDAATRVDPNWTPWRRYLAGLSYFSLGRFEDAVASLEKIDFSLEERCRSPWDKYLRLELLIAAEGHLGRAADAASVRRRSSPI